MAAPTAAFTVIPLADVDPDSPVSSDLMNSLRLNDQNLFAQLVGDPVTAPTFTAAAEHDHDGVNSKSVTVPNMIPKEAIDGTLRSHSLTTIIPIPGTKITYTAAELSINRKALVILTGSFQSSTLAAGRIITFGIRVDGVDQTEVVSFDPEDHLATNSDHGFSISALVDLVSGANRDIEATFTISPSGTVRVSQSQIQTILVV